MSNVLETCFLVPGLTSATCAAWVQAWGTLFAIAVASMVAWYQLRHTSRAREARRKEVFGALGLLIESLSVSADGWLKRFIGSSRDAESREARVFRDIAATVAAFPLEQVLDADAVRVLLLARVHIPAFISAIETRYPRPENEDDWRELINHSLQLQLLTAFAKSKAGELPSAGSAARAA